MNAFLKLPVHKCIVNMYLHLSISRLRFEDHTEESSSFVDWSDARGTAWTHHLPVDSGSIIIPWANSAFRVKLLWPQIFSNKHIGPFHRAYRWMNSPLLYLNSKKNMSVLTGSFLDINQFIWPLVLSYPFITALLLLFNLIVWYFYFLFNVCNFYLCRLTLWHFPEISNDI